jgi:ADP-dependent NAD(P)H-hydrate dehydratase / NAD(P)H-hydrate epimerase
LLAEKSYNGSISLLITVCMNRAIIGEKMKLVTVPQMRLIEQEANGSGLSFEKMMENAGYNLSRDVIRLTYAQDDEEEIQILGLIGPGNNGGDTLIALARLAEKGWKARAYLIHRKVTGDVLIKRLEEADGEVYEAGKDESFHQLQAFIESADVVLDGVLGTGFNLPLKDEIGSALAAVQGIVAEMEWPPLIIAVDCPSGVDCDSGKAAPQTIPADATVTMAAVKQGLLKLPAYDLIGELRVVNIGNLDDLQSWQDVKNEIADKGMASSILPLRPTDAHKGTFGTAIIAAGSINYTGAAMLAGKAAYRIGAGLVTLAIPSSLHGSLAGHFPEATWVLLPHELGVIASEAADVLMKNLDHATALLVGPGLGLEDTTRDFLANLLEGKTEKVTHGRMGFVQGKGADTDLIPVSLPPLVLDADGLKLLSRIPDWPKLLPTPAVLTPHPGEMSVLTGLAIDEIQKDRLNVARKYSQEWGHVVVLKGAFTVIAAPDGRTTTIPLATPALARAGTGDVLAGLITGLRAQGVDAYDAARAGAWIHAQAGLLAAEIEGSSGVVMAGDVLEAIPDVIADLV